MDRISSTFAADRFCLIITEGKGEIIFINRNAANALGLTSDKFNQQLNLAKFVYKDDLPSLKERMKMILSTGSGNLGQFKIITGSGVTKQVRCGCLASNLGGRSIYLYVFENAEADLNMEMSERFISLVVSCIGYPILCINDDGLIVTANEEFEQFLEWKHDALLNCNIDVAIPRFLSICLQRTKKIPDQHGRFFTGKVACRKQSGVYIDCQLTASRLVSNMIIVILRNVPDEKLLQEISQKDRILKNVNTALTVLLERYGQAKSVTNDRIAANIRQNIMPYINILRDIRLNDERSLECLDLIETNLKNITAPFSARIESREFGLTQRELEIAQLVKQGQTSKQIAKFLRISTRAVDSHRYNLRKKLGVNKEVSSLCSFFKLIG